LKPKENCLHVFNREQIICQRLIPTYSGSREQGHYKNNPSSIDNPKTKMNFYPSKNFIQKLKRKISSRPTTLFATSVSGLPQTLYEIFPPLLHTFVTVLTGQVNDTTFSPNKFITTDIVFIRLLTNLSSRVAEAWNSARWLRKLGPCCPQ